MTISSLPGPGTQEHLRLLRELGIRSAVIVPLTGTTGTFGALTMIAAESGRRFDEDDRRLAEDLARRAALAVETAEAFRAQSGRLAAVSRVAEAAQRAILAPAPARVGPVALAARYVSAFAEAQIGGDLYEVVPRPGAIRLIVADVRGKGLEAVRTATVVLGEFRAAAADLDDLTAVAVQIDRRLAPYLGEEDFVTAVLAEIVDDGTLTVASCGHPAAVIAARDGAVLRSGPARQPAAGSGNPAVAVHGSALGRGPGAALHRRHRRGARPRRAVHRPRRGPRWSDGRIAGRGPGPDTGQPLPASRPRADR